MIINMPRGDLRKIKFSINDNQGNILDTNFDEIYISFKKNYIDENVLFQKRLTDGSITKDEENYYHFSIDPQDTDNLRFGDYVFDIEIVKDGSIKQTTIGTLNLTSEVTFYKNEGV